MMEQSDMGAQEVALGWKVRAAQSICPGEILSPEQCRYDDGAFSMPSP